MTDKPLHFLASLLLAAVMLTGGGGLPSYCHCHTGGGNSHSHHDHEAHEGHDHHDDHDSSLREAAVAHVHFLWLCFGVSLPLDSEDGDEHQPPTFLSLGHSQQIAMVVSSSNEIVLHQQVENTLVLFPVVVDKQARRASSQTIALPLCAKARHERAGVQLI